MKLLFLWHASLPLYKAIPLDLPPSQQSMSMKNKDPKS